MRIARVSWTAPLHNRGEAQAIDGENDRRVEDLASETESHKTHVEHDRVSHYLGRKGRSAMVPLLMLACLVQAPEMFDVTAVGKDPRWQIAGRTAAVVDTNGKHALRLPLVPIMGLVCLNA